MKRHAKVHFGYKYDFKKNVCVPLTEDSTTEEKLHQYIVSSGIRRYKKK